MILPKATPRYDPKDQDQLRNALEVAVTKLEQTPGLSQVSGDRGDNSITINAGTDLEVQRFATALTANRTVTLGTGGPGAKFRIVRTGLGAFTLAVGAVKTIPSATAAFVDVGSDGTGWFLTGYGTL